MVYDISAYIFFFSKGWQGHCHIYYYKKLYIEFPFVWFGKGSILFTISYVSLKKIWYLNNGSAYLVLHLTICSELQRFHNFHSDVAFFEMSQVGTVTAICVTCFLIRCVVVSILFPLTDLLVFKEGRLIIPLVGRKQMYDVDLSRTNMTHTVV